MHGIDSNDLTLDRWLQTVSDEEAIRALTHALAVVKVRAELRQQHVSAPCSAPGEASPATIEAPVDAAAMRKPSLEQALSVQLQPEPTDQSRIAVPVAEAAVEVVTVQVPLPSVVVDELQNTKPLVAALTDATQAPVVAVETDSSVASTFNRATAKTLVFDRSAVEAKNQSGAPALAAVPAPGVTEPVVVDHDSMGKTMQFGMVTPAPAAIENSSSAAKTLLISASNTQTPAMMPRRDSLEESLLVPQRNKLAVIAMLAAGAMLLVGLGALVAAVLSPSEPVAVVAPKEDDVAPSAAAEVAPVVAAQQTDEAVQRARAAAAIAAETKRVDDEEEAARMAAVKTPTLAPVVEAKKMARTVAEPISGEKPAMVAVSPKAMAPAPAPVPVGAPKSVAAPAPVAVPKTVAAPPSPPSMVTPKHTVSAPAPAPKRGSQSADPLDSRR